MWALNTIKNIGSTVKKIPGKNWATAIAALAILVWGHNYVQKDDITLFEHDFREKLAEEIKDSNADRTEIEKIMARDTVSIVIQDWTDSSTRRIYHTFRDSANNIVSDDKNNDLDNSTDWNMLWVKVPLYLFDHENQQVVKSNIAFERTRGDGISDADDWKFYNRIDNQNQDNEIHYLEWYKVLAISDPYNQNKNITYFNPKIHSGYREILSSPEVQNIKESVNWVAENTKNKVSETLNSWE